MRKFPKHRTDGKRVLTMNDDKLYDLFQKCFDRIETRLISIENRMRDVENTIAETKGKSSGLVTAKDVFVVICGIAAVILSFVRLTQ